MTNPRDEIDEWLSGDVTPLNPAPGSLDRIRHRARKRKQRQAVLAAVGCAVVLGAAVSVPQLLSARSGHQGGQPTPAVAASPQVPSAQPAPSGTKAGGPSPARVRRPGSAAHEPVHDYLWHHSARKLPADLGHVRRHR